MQGAERWLPSAAEGSTAYNNTAGVSVTASILQKSTELGATGDYNFTSGSLYSEASKQLTQLENATRFLEPRVSLDHNYPGHVSTEATSVNRRLLDIEPNQDQLAVKGSWTEGTYIETEYTRSATGPAMHSYESESKQVERFRSEDSFRYGNEGKPKEHEGKLTETSSKAYYISRSGSKGFLNISDKNIREYFGSSSLDLTTSFRDRDNYSSSWFQRSADRQSPFVFTRLDDSFEEAPRGVGKGAAVSSTALDWGDLNRNTPLNTSATALAHDVERMTKMLASPQGLKFATHQVENAAVSVMASTYWAKKKTAEQQVKLLKHIGQEAIAAGLATADVLAQTAVAGTGVHFEPYSFKSYLGKDSLVDIVGMGGAGKISIGKNLTSAKFDAEDSDKIKNNTDGEGKFAKFPGPLKDRDTEWLNKFNLIPFEIVSIVPENDIHLYFQANLDSYSDSFTGNWNGTQYIGRAEKFYTYEGFDRSIDFSFKVVARNANDLVPLYKQLNNLVGTTAPTYGEGSNYMRGTLVKVTVGDLLGLQPGFFKSIKLSWKTEYPWSVGADTAGNKNEQLIVPHMLDVSVSFTPIHNFNVDARPEITDDSMYFGFLTDESIDTQMS